MENFLREDVVFKLRKTRQKLALSLTPLGAVRAAAQGTGYKNRRLGKSHGVRFDSRLVLSLRYDALWVWNCQSSSCSCSHFECLWEQPGYLSSTCIVVGAVNFTVTPAENFVSPLSESSPRLRESIKKKKSFSPHDSQFIQANVHIHFQVHSSSSRLCVRQIESEQQSVGEVSHLLEVLAPACRLAGPDNAAPSLPDSDGWLSKEKKKFRSLFKSFTSWWRSSYILDVQCQNILDVVVNKQMTGCMSGLSPPGCLTVSCHLCDQLTITVRDKPAAWLVTVM